jgi:PIN domain nuclease of toxin-antitoxin system/antitoxin (DNA-binding transcriptional repressor) of toxin-antitoxin stability system
VVNVHEAKTQLSRLLLLVEEGEEVWIARAGQPVARLTPWLGEVTAVQAPGAMREAITIAADFDAPLALPGNAAPSRPTAAMSRLLLDTQLLLWWLADDPRLPAAALAMVQAPGAEVFVSQVSLWELAHKRRQGLVELDLARLEQEVPRQNFRWLPLRNAHLLALAALEATPCADPFDLLLIAQSRQEPLLLLTADSGLQPFGATVLLLDPQQHGPSTKPSPSPPR